MLISIRTSFARLAVLFFFIFDVFILQFSQKQIESFLLSSPYRCPLRLLPGWKCAFCGMTHSWIAMFRGEVLTAFKENLFGPFLWLGSIIFLIIYSMPSLENKIATHFSTFFNSYNRIILGMPILILIAYTFFRNMN